MRDTVVDQGGLFSYIAPDARVPANHPLRKIRELVRDVLDELTRSLGRLSASEGPLSIPPEQLLSALLLQVFYDHPASNASSSTVQYRISRTVVSPSTIPFVRIPASGSASRDSILAVTEPIPIAEMARKAMGQSPAGLFGFSHMWEATGAAKPNTPRAHGGGRAD